MDKAASIKDLTARIRKARRVGTVVLTALELLVVALIIAVEVRDQARGRELRTQEAVELVRARRAASHPQE